MQIQIGRVYKHFKHGNLYMPVAIAIHSETDEKMVVYRQYPCVSESKTFVRPLWMWFEEIDKDKYPNVKQKYRFELVENQMVDKTLH